MKTSEKANMHIRTGLARPLALCILGAQEVTTNGIYRLPHATSVASQCQTLHELRAGDHE